MINWGIIGAGNIAARFAQSLNHFAEAQLYGVACRTLDKATAFQSQYPCEEVFDDYQQLLNEPEIDLVYIALPHLYHHEWILKALKAGKGVLCEKPATMNAEQMNEVAKIARKQNVFFMEAMKSRFVPAYRAVREVVAAGKIGQIISLSTSLCREMPETQTSYHYLPVQGGALLDMGIYNLSLIEDFSPADLTVGKLDYRLHKNQIDVYLKATLVQENFEAIIETGFDRNTDTVAVITGTKGVITIPDFHRTTCFTLTVENETKNFDVPYDRDDFYSEIEAVHSSFNKNEIENPIMTLENSMRCLSLLDLIKDEISSR
ncbi:hypothetical protein IGI39_004185 [Enterococcus sp. AZ135]|uniref:Gfo/Idh/MocA family protein n=1 Tax=unclassified Enterococcus TaxID=2608891 RepID=UPI003F2581BE